MIKSWIRAFRLRTLPLSFSSIIMGNALAYKSGQFEPGIFYLSCLTTLFLQVLSNLANDYGDFKKGTDNDSRLGPTRALQSGMITETAMKRAIGILVMLSLLSGLSLLYIAFDEGEFLYALAFLGIGLLAIWAAVNYTAGSIAYGYRALGDVFVFLFFGIVGVMGSFYLQARQVEPQVLLPAISIGAFSAGVLNINNLRDLEPDKAAGKITVPVLIGRYKAKLYHVLLLDIGWLSALFYALNYFASREGMLIMLIPTLVIFKNAFDVIRNTDPAKLNPKLRDLALGTFLFAVLFATALNL